MTHEQILNSLKENIQLIYRQSVDADQSIEALKEQDKANFIAIFGDNTPFTTRSARFLVHVEELAADLLALQQSNSNEEFERDLPRLVKKIELMFKTLQNFKQGLRG
ncbi:hypothetical protein K6Y31_09885 [Motilimonas cestriensis]|uniref:Prephenate dehydrogenase n=1 Tax=Motilimonas cestriensis TaxID=2742685 RepID=A0ABS8WBP9_9GAMM|nr:hypothetical protein [Motilimonas cestriensis]MCE2595128.1 hypothetical protein [Motilimonas cestriensis]